MKDFKLCYIEGNFAYFTTQDLDKQTGDDWNDAPYDLNAGEPYTPTIYYPSGKKDPRDWTNGKPNWEIKKLVWEGDFDEAKNIYMEDINCIYCVDDINNKKVPWLEYQGYSNEDLEIKIWAGCSIKEFKKLIKKGGGKIYVEEK